MRKLLTSILLLFSSFIIFGQSKDEIAIKKILDAQVDAWNGGNIHKFMEGYWQNDSLMFIGKSGITYGWQQTLNNYQKHYPDTASMGKLNFDSLAFKPLSPMFYFIVGRWHLQRSIGNLEGYFTLLFRKINGKWFIIADHSS